MKTIIIAGSKSAGKTTLFNHLKKHLTKIHFQPEINPYTILGPNFAGGAFTPRQAQEQILNLSYQVATELSNQPKPTVIWETGIMVLAYVNHMDYRWYSEVKDKFFSLFQNLNTSIVYIQTKPEICWTRRKMEYEQRIKKYLKEKKIKSISERVQISRARLKKYRTSLIQMAVEFNNLITKLPLPIFYLDNNSRPESDFLAKGLKLVQNILNEN